MSRILTYSLCVVLALQGALALLLQQDRLASIKGALQGDIELICTGAQMKWISLSQTQALGQFVYVNAPEQYEELPLDNLCPAGNLADSQSAPGLIGPGLLVQFDQFKALVSRLHQRPYTLFAYQQARSRAPPFA